MRRLFMAVLLAFSVAGFSQSVEINGSKAEPVVGGWALKVESTTPKNAIYQCTRAISARANTTVHYWDGEPENGQEITVTYDAAGYHFNNVTYSRVADARKAVKLYLYGVFKLD